MRWTLIQNPKSKMHLSVRTGTHEAQFATEAPQLKEGQPDIRQPEAGDRPPQEVVARDARKQRVVTHKIIPGPERNPREDKQKHANLEAEHDVHDRQQAIHLIDRSGISVSGKSIGVTPAAAGGLSGLLLELADLVRHSAEVDILAIDLSKSLQGIAGIAGLLVRHAQIILQGHERLLVEAGCLQRT